MKNHLFKDPTKYRLIYMFILWTAGLVLSALVMRDIFLEGVFQRKYLLLIFVICLSTIKLVRLFMAYKRSSSSKLQE